MKKDNTFTFNTSISREGYTDKKEAQLCLSNKGAKIIGKSKMAFKEQTVSVTEFLDYAVNGHSFCNLFSFDENKKYLIRNAYRSKRGEWCSTLTYPVYKTGDNKGYFKMNFKSDEYFRGSQTIFVDVDFTHYDSLESYISCLTYKPTCGYYSYSDKKDKRGLISRRFRLVYVFDTELSADRFRDITFYLYDSIVADTKEQMYDTCGCSYSQYMNGGNNTDTYRSDIIYSENEFPVYHIYEPEVEEVSSEVEETGNKRNTKTISFTSELISDMLFNQSYEYVVRKWYAMGLRYIVRTELDFNDNYYVTTTEDYVELPYIVNRVEDGQHRRRKLYKRAALRRLMKEDITPDEMLYNLYIDRYKFFDNTDNVLDIECLIERVKRAYKTDIKDIRDMYTFKNKKFVINSEVTDKRKAVAAARRDITDSLIGEMYDCDMTVKENLSVIQEAGYKLSLSSLYEWCKRYNIEKKKPSTRRSKEVVTGYNPELSIRENMKVMGCKKNQVEKAKREWTISHT